MNTSAPPRPMDDETVQDPLECPPLKWGILGCGRVSHDFTQALKLLPSSKVVACAARNAQDAETFAKKHNIPSSYGGYEGLVNNAEVDIVYVGNIHAFRRQTGEMCLLANKHLLLEKPFACNTSDAEYLMALAKERNLFLMEGMWTRFFPAVEKARQLVFGTKDEPGVLGEVVKVISDFNFNASDSEEYPTSFMYNHGLGGGSSYLVAPYPISAATLFFGGATPDSIKAVGQVDDGTGVDLQSSICLSFPPTSDIAPASDNSNHGESTPKLPGAGVAVLSFGLLGESMEETTIIGTKGRMTIRTPGHCPTQLSVTLKGQGRGATAGTMEYEYPLPADTEEIITAGSYFYPNSAGFAYEAAAVARCIAAGKIEAPQFTLADTLNNTRVIDEARRQLGVAPLSSP